MSKVREKVVNGVKGEVASGVKKTAKKTTGKK